MFQDYYFYLEVLPSVSVGFVLKVKSEGRIIKICFSAFLSFISSFCINDSRAYQPDC